MRPLILTLLLTSYPAFAADPPAPSPAEAPKEEGVPLVVTVLDASTGLPVPFARVRETREKSLNGVNRANGQFSTTHLYPSYNEEIPLRKGMELVMEITAAQYVPAEVRWTMKGRNNRLIVKLEPMAIQATIDADPVFQFGRDRPIDGYEMSEEEKKRIEQESEATRKKREAEGG